MEWSQNCGQSLAATRLLPLLNRQGWRRALENWVFFIWSQIVDDKASKDELVKWLDVSPTAELTYDIWMNAESKRF